MSRFVLLNLSDRKRAENEVRSQELRYRLLFENSMDAIFLTAPDGRIFDANPSACSMFGRTRDEITAAGREVEMSSWTCAIRIWLACWKNDSVRAKPMEN